MSSSNKMNSVFYAESYHPIQAGSIDGTDILPHDNAVYRAHLCTAAGLYDPFGDPKVIGDPYCTLFVGRLSDQTDEESLRKAMSKYGRVKNLQLVRHIVTGAPRGYAFVEYETDREMRHAYKDAHHSIIDGNEIIVDYYRQQLMPGWIPRRLGGGLGGKKESAQLRFGGRERPFRAPLRPIPYDDLKRLGIPPPPEGQYMPLASRFHHPQDGEAAIQAERIQGTEYPRIGEAVVQTERTHPQPQGTEDPRIKEVVQSERARPQRQGTEDPRIEEEALIQSERTHAHLQGTENPKDKEAIMEVRRIHLQSIRDRKIVSIVQCVEEPHLKETCHLINKIDIIENILIDIIRRVLQLENTVHIDIRRRDPGVENIVRRRQKALVERYKDS